MFAKHFFNIAKTLQRNVLQTFLCKTFLSQNISFSHACASSRRPSSLDASLPVLMRRRSHDWSLKTKRLRVIRRDLERLGPRSRKCGNSVQKQPRSTPSSSTSMQPCSASIATDAQRTTPCRVLGSTCSSAASVRQHVVEQHQRCTFLGGNALLQLLVDGLPQLPRGLQLGHDVAAALRWRGKCRGGERMCGGGVVGAAAAVSPIISAFKVFRRSLAL